MNQKAVPNIYSYITSQVLPLRVERVRGDERAHLKKMDGSD